MMDGPMDGPMGGQMEEQMVLLQNMSTDWANWMQSVDAQEVVVEVEGVGTRAAMTSARSAMRGATALRAVREVMMGETDLEMRTACATTSSAVIPPARAVMAMYRRAACA